MQKLWFGHELSLRRGRGWRGGGVSGSGGGWAHLWLGRDRGRGGTYHQVGVTDGRGRPVGGRVRRGRVTANRVRPGRSARFLVSPAEGAGRRGARRVARPEGARRRPTRPSRRHESRGAARHPGQRHRSVGRGRGRGRAREEPPLTPRPALPGRPREGSPGPSPGRLRPLRAVASSAPAARSPPVGSGRRRGLRAAVHVPRGPQRGPRCRVLFWVHDKRALLSSFLFVLFFFFWSRVPGGRTSEHPHGPFFGGMLHKQHVGSISGAGTPPPPLQRSVLNFPFLPIVYMSQFLWSLTANKMHRYEELFIWMSSDSYAHPRDQRPD